MYKPGGLIAMLKFNKKGEIFYNTPFLTNKHINTKESFVPALNFCFLDSFDRGLLVTSSSGIQSFKVNGDKGRIGLCMGKSTTCRPIKTDSKLDFTKKDDDVHVLATKLENDIFYGEYVHKFLIYPFKGNWKKQNIPYHAKSYTREVYYEDVDNVKLNEESLLKVSPSSIDVTYLDDKKIRINEICGKETKYRIEINGKIIKGEIKANGIDEIQF
jgi:hypothetical protein